jgi:hypothetical protein
LAEKSEVARENKEFCNELGFNQQHAGHARCMNGLDELRLKQKERQDATFAGFL